MSRNSKARRDLRRKKQPAGAIRRLGAALQPHAQLLDQDDASVGGVGWRDNEWLLVLGGRVVAHSESAAMALAMLRHVMAVQAQADHPLRLEASPALLHAAGREAAALGHTLEEYLAELERERREREPQAVEPPPTAH